MLILFVSLSGEHYIPHGGFSYTRYFRQGCQRWSWNVSSKPRESFQVFVLQYVSEWNSRSTNTSSTWQHDRLHLHPFPHKHLSVCSGILNTCRSDCRVCVESCVTISIHVSNQICKRICKWILWFSVTYIFVRIYRFVNTYISIRILKTHLGIWLCTNGLRYRSTILHTHTHINK